MVKVTIREIARRAGVSKAAVTYALNGQPGVSEATRARVLQIADELDWAPNQVARQLSVARSETLGLILARPAQTLSEEPFYMAFVAGLEGVLGQRSYTLALRMVNGPDEELAAYRKWSREKRVDGVVVVDVNADDARIPLLKRLGLPAVLVGDPQLADGLACVWTDSTTAMSAAVDHLAELGHRRIARIAGPADHGHVWIRDTAFAAATRRTGLSAEVVHTDFSGAQGAAATRTLMASTGRPTAIIYDNDLMAVAGLSALDNLDIRCPDDVTLIAWDDSALCRITHPTLTAMSHDVVGYGAEVATRLFDLLEGAAPAAHLYSTPQLRIRQSSGPLRA
ncbi:LacI family DNA-binding transcriptional regulator [Kribbella sp. NPDC005582]|uniref:LacI family DNA-binding transcriptional regulator n=1 Tax=Kribbella sp. NPDC005582 TaxID=3156893 RepID=UPI00339E60D1